MKSYLVFSVPYIDAKGAKHRRAFVGTVEARTITSAVKKARKKFRDIGLKLTVGRMNYKTGQYEEREIEK